MAQEYKHSFNGRMKISAGYKPGNMAAFMYGGTKRKREKKVNEVEGQMSVFDFPEVIP